VYVVVAFGFTVTATRQLETAPTRTLESGAMKARLPKINWVHVAVELAGGAQTVAKHVGVTRAAVYKWIDRTKMGHVDATTMQKLSELSGVPIDKLI
jgi:hypothetical protein